MKATVEAVYQDGVFRPVYRPNLAEGERVRLVFEKAPKPSPDRVLQLAAAVYDGASPQDLADLEEMSRRRDLFLDRQR